MRSTKYKARNNSGLFLVPRPRPKIAMSVPKSQRMTLRGIVGWSLLCGGLAAVVAVVTAVVVHWSNEYAFRDYSTGQMILMFAGAFLFGTVLPMGYLVKIKWMEEEGPAEIADEIERKLNG